MPEGLLPALAPRLAREESPTPPRRFREAGTVRAAWSCEGPFGRTVPRLRGSAAQRAGIRYERKVLKQLKLELPSVWTSPWFRFQTERDSRWCQPDALLKSSEDLVIFEVKIRSTTDAWWQLEHLYKPVVEKAFERRVTGIVLICKHLDPMVGLPGEPHHVFSFRDASLARGFSVMQWQT